MEDATERGKEAIEGFVAALVKLGEPVPVEEPALIALVVEVATETASPPLVATG